MAYEIFAWILAGLTAWGAVLNVKKNRNGFLIWMVTNATWAVIDFFKGIPQQTAVFGLFFGLAFWGYFSWSHESGLEKERVIKIIKKAVQEDDVLRQAIKGEVCDVGN